MKQRRSRQEWERLVTEFKRSRQTQRAFAAQHGLSAKTFSYWVNGRKGRAHPQPTVPRVQGKAAAAGSGLRLVPVRVRIQPTPPSHAQVIARAAHIEVRIGTSVRVRFAAATDPVELARFVKALWEVAPC